MPVSDLELIRKFEHVLNNDWIVTGQLLEIISMLGHLAFADGLGERDRAV